VSAVDARAAMEGGAVEEATVEEATVEEGYRRGASR
jgi:hypothetical protein